MDSILVVTENDRAEFASRISDGLSTELGMRSYHCPIDGLSTTIAGIPSDVDRILVVPLVPAPCGFTNETIPEVLGIGSGNREGEVDGKVVMVTDTFGTHPRIKDVLYDHVVPLEPEAGTTCIVMVGVKEGDRDDTVALKEWAALIRGFNIDAFYALDGEGPSSASRFEEMVEQGYKHMVVVPALSDPDIDSVDSIDVVLGSDIAGADGVLGIIAHIIRRAVERGTVLPPVKPKLGSMETDALNSLIQRLGQNRN